MISLKLIYKERLSQSHKITQIGFNQIIYSFYCPQERYEWLVEAKIKRKPHSSYAVGLKDNFSKAQYIFCYEINLKGLLAEYHIVF